MSIKEESPGPNYLKGDNLLSLIVQDGGILL